MTTDDRLGIVVFAHGSRDPLWRAPIEAVAEALRRRHPELPVRCAYLELTEPDLASAVDDLLDQGATRVRVMPLFFGMGRHAREDLPALCEALRQRHPHLRLELLAPVGEDPRLTALLCELALAPTP